MIVREAAENYMNRQYIIIYYKSKIKLLRNRQCPVRQSSAHEIELINLRFRLLAIGGNLHIPCLPNGPANVSSRVFPVLPPDIHRGS